MASSAPVTVFPWECRDKEDQAKASYEFPLRRANQELTEENLRLKRILRENGISWSPVAQAHLKQRDPNKRRTRSSMAHDLGRPHLPTEVILRILKFALTSAHPIIDPLSPTTSDHLTEREKTRGNQIAIHILATCRALQVEGTRYLWEGNEFTFTTPEALRHFAELSPGFRHKVTTVRLRIVARYYDDQRRKHKLERYYHADLKRDQNLKVQMRPKETPLVRGGFRCYTWTQIVDFLAALRAPYDPAYRDKKNPRPRLFPALSTLRMDLVNFSDTLLPFSGSELHDIASHELGCTLNELQITGMPFDDAGMKASAELSGMLKDEGLYLDGPASFIALSKHLQPLSGQRWCARVIRAWKGNPVGSDYDDDDEVDDNLAHFNGNHQRLGALPPAPVEQGHPTSTRDEDTVIWKKVPTSRDGHKRTWIQFSRFSGYEINDLDDDSEDEGVCPCCGESHPGSSFLEYMMADDLD
ncbi:hypothetical protein JDV02_007823 [Purpureocillium takamizusanense]|uniref:Uncharacterized protein n=1 Tax=Purpureocillium takamizusanense TaxID=2060973 RepID=A0A9Q8VEG6_9HYPO|nr:uncharacterized protein JDV02_007823 [Purpureocillium takamizusanense]UNI21874.1 hypothetical protein JDV02_007823 [Purpureocillium takamizusanense]